MFFKKTRNIDLTSAIEVDESSEDDDASTPEPPNTQSSTYDEDEFVFDLCMDLIRNMHQFRIANICMVVVIMICLSPSNAHVERMVKAMNHIKTSERVKLVQGKLNSLFRVSANSQTSKTFDPQPVIDHWISLSAKALEKGTDVVLQEGQKVPNIFRLKSQYTSNRQSCAKQKVTVKVESSEMSSVPTILTSSQRIAVNMPSPAKTKASPPKSPRIRPATQSPDKRKLSPPKSPRIPSTTQSPDKRKVSPAKSPTTTPGKLSPAKRNLVPQPGTPKTKKSKVDLSACQSPNIVLPQDKMYEAIVKSHKSFMRTHAAELESVFPPNKLCTLKEFLELSQDKLLNPVRGGPNISVYDLKCLLGYSFVPSDVLTRYHEKLGNQCSDIYFPPATLFHLLSSDATARVNLEVPNFDRYRFVFWSILIPSPKRDNDHWVGAVHSTRNNSHLFYVDTWGSDEQRRSRVPPNLLEVVNSFLLQQKPPISVTSFQMLNAPPQQECSCGCCVNEFARRLSEDTTSFFSMQPFEPSFLMRIKQAKEILDFVLGI